MMPKHKPWTAAGIKRASEMWTAGKTRIEIGAEMDRSADSVRRMIERNREIFPYRAKNPKKWTKSELVEVSRQWREGRLVRFIAKEFNMTPMNIYRLAARRRDLFPVRQEQHGFSAEMGDFNVRLRRQHADVLRKRAQQDGVPFNRYMSRILEAAAQPLDNAGAT